VSGDLILKRGLVAAEGTHSEEGQNNAMCHTKALRLEEASGIARVQQQLDNYEPNQNLVTIS
jgi:hypothetical protein